MDKEEKIYATFIGTLTKQQHFIYVAIGIIVFTFMSWIWFREPITLKTGICLTLALLIMGVQIFWK
jgi:hypothetical protein